MQVLLQAGGGGGAGSIADGRFMAIRPLHRSPIDLRRQVRLAVAAYKASTAKTADGLYQKMPWRLPTDLSALLPPS